MCGILHIGKSLHRKLLSVNGHLAGRSCACANKLTDLAMSPGQMGARALLHRTSTMEKTASRFPNILHMEHRCNYQKIHIESFHFGNVQDILSWIDLWWNWASDENPDHPGRCTQTPEFWRHNRYTITVSVESTHKNWVVMPPCYNWNSSCYQ